MKPSVLAKELKEILNNRLDGLVHDVVIFGSRIQYKARPDSDWDVLIILHSGNTRRIRRAISDICYELDLKYNIFIDSQIITMDEINNGIISQHPVVTDAIKEGIHAE